MTDTDYPSDSWVAFKESGDEVLRLDSEGFHYRDEFIADAGEAHRLMVTYLQRYTSMHPESVEQEVNWRELCAELIRMVDSGNPEAEEHTICRIRAALNQHS